MAKTKLLQNAKTALSHLDDSIGDLLEDVHQTISGRGNGLTEAHTANFFKSRTEARTAFAAALKHADDLARRMSDEKTMSDRLRNLKNVFKDSKALQAARQQYRTDLNAVYEDYVRTEETWEGIVNSYVKNAASSH